jgi:Na+/melibiose symporter-like transporter
MASQFGEDAGQIDRPEHLSRSTALFYGAGAVASAAKSVPISTFLMIYYHQVVGLSALTVSSILTISLVLDAFWDPIVGEVSDNFRSNLGRRLPFMYLSIVPVSILFVMLWAPPRDWSQSGIAVYLACCLIGIRLFDTFFEVPHLALVPELTSDYDQRTRLFTLRYLFEGAGGILISALAYNVFMKERGDGTGGLLSPDGYPHFAIFTGMVIFAAMLTCTQGLKGRVPVWCPGQSDRASLRDRVRSIFDTVRTRSFAVLASAAVLIAITSGLASSLNIYWMVYFYRFTQAQISVLFLPVLLGMALIILAPVLARKLGKARAVVTLLWVNAAVGALPLMLRMLGYLPAESDASLVLVGLQGALGAASMTMVLILFSSMVADLTEDAELRTGHRSEGVLLSVMSFLRKATQGLGTLCAGIILTVVDFPTQVDRFAAKPEVLDHLVWVYLGVNLVLVGMSATVLRWYGNDHARYERTLELLSARSAGRS